jgi:enoyl-CoA hydratase/carnithine racemase
VNPPTGTDSTNDVALVLEGAVATITLDRRGTRNALNPAFAREIVKAFDEAEARKARVVVLRSGGPVFCAGVDLGDPMRLGEDSPELLVAGALQRSPLLVVTVIDGPVLAGGLILAALSPVVIASERAEFWLPERTIGLFPGRVLAFLEQVVPPRQAFWLGLIEQRIGADAATGLGLVSEIASSADIDARAHDLAAGLAASAPGFAEAARAAWALRFTGAEHRARRAELDVLLRENVAMQSTELQ